MEPETQVQPAREKRPRRGVRSGTLMDTGDAMPRTEFRRPNPLDSDVIMDATARLLAPRPLTLSGGQEQSRRNKRKKPAHKSQEQAAQTQQAQHAPKQSAAQESRDNRAGKNGQSAKTAKGSKSRKDRTTPQKRSRGGYQRGLPPEPHRQQKDSTEQPSLMKPFYINVGR